MSKKNSQNTCRLCGEQNKMFGHSIKEEVIKNFLRKTSIKLKSKKGNAKISCVCNICYAKAKIVNDFVDKVLQQQELFETNTSIDFNQSENLYEKVKQIGQMSIRKVTAPKKTSQSHMVVIKQEVPEKLNIKFEKESNDGDDDDSDYKNDSENDSDNDQSSVNKSYSDEDYEPLVKKQKTSITVGKKQKSLNATTEPESSLYNNQFKCGKCKSTHATFVELEKHVHQCFKPSNTTTTFDCHSCKKKFPTRKKMLEHSKTHFFMKQASTSTAQANIFPSKNMKSIKRLVYKCKKCSCLFYNLESLKQHKIFHANDASSNKT